MYLNKVQQLSGSVFRISFSAPKKDLIIEPGRRMHITEYANTAPDKASQISMVLRKYLSSKKVKKVWQKENDRVMVIDFEGFKLITELFSNGNFILTDDDYNIIFTFLTEEWKDREIKKGVKYVFPANMTHEAREDYSPVTKELVAEKGANRAIDDYYSAIKIENPKLKSLQNRLDHQRAALEDYKKQSDEEKAKGDFIYSNYSAIQKILDMSKDDAALAKLGIKKKAKKLTLEF